ncbi:MAG: VanZ family protein [Nitrospirota bacterium]
MNSLISFLGKHKLVNILIGACYYLATVLLHEEVSKVSVWIQDKLTLMVYNNLITVIGVALIVAMSSYIANRIRLSSDRYFRTFYLFMTIGLVVLSYTTLMVVNVEAIHFLQYTMLAIPVFAVTLHFGDTLFWTTFLGAIDEAYQYFVLKNWKYFDFNDIVLNLVGGAIGVMLIYIMLDYKRFAPDIKNRKWFKSPAIITSALLTVSSLLLYMAGVVRTYPGPDSRKAVILLSKELPSKEFWISFKWGKTYHILKPVEGIILCIVLAGIYYLIDYRVRTKQL